MRYTVNANVCTEYLRSIGVEVSDDVAAAWAATEKETRRLRRAHKAELKRSCGHFRTYTTRIHSVEGSWISTTCSDCRKPLKYEPLNGGGGGGGRPIPRVA